MATRLTDEQCRLAESRLNLADQAVSVFHRKYGNWIPHDDLTSAAYLGLTNAARRFDPARNTTFETFAWTRIWAAIIEEVRDAKGRIRDGQPAASPRRVPNALMLTLDDRQPDTVDAEKNFLERDELDCAIAHLPERDRLIVVLRYWQDISQREISEMLEISEGRVSQILLRALRHMQRELAPDQSTTQGGMR